jgi:ACS family hexuronate transporter-like MFS transporter
MLIRALAGPVVHFYWYWLPEYLKRERNFSMDMIALMAGIPFLFAGLGNVAGGWFSGFLMKQCGWSVDRARKTAFAAAGALCTLSVLVPLVPGEVPPLALISAATFGLAMSVANHIGLLTDLFEPRVLARLTGLSGLCEGVINIAVTLATGRVVDQFGYLPVFVAAGIMPLAAVSSLFLIVRRVQPVR